jgi:hypothetical protein
VLLAALAFACMVVPALAGWGVARGLRPPSRDAAGASRSVTIGPARLKVPSSWIAIDNPASAGIPGLDSTSTRAFRIEDGLGRHAFVTLAPPADHLLIPSSLRPALRPPIGAPMPAFLAGYPAWSYSNVATARPNVVMELTVVPTTAGVLAVACTSRLLVAPSGCDLDVKQIFVSAAHVLRPTADAAFRLAMSTVLTRLQHDRAASEGQLNAARDAGAQALGLEAFAKAYATAARGLDRFAPRRGPAATLVASLDSAGGAYRAAGTAARIGAVGDYSVARAAVRAAESKVATALGRVG